MATKPKQLSWTSIPGVPTLLLKFAGASLKAQQISYFHYRV
jgi:hypothetical protein